jgi:HlyD family secretion protein
MNFAKNHRHLRTAVEVVAVAMVIAGVIYKMKFAPVPVVTAQVASGQVVAEVMGTGTLEARVKTTISPRIQERLAEVLVDQNDRVASGQLLARLDDGELKQQVEVANATLEGARATAERVKTDEARAVAVEKQARLTHQRVSELLATKITSQEDLDKAVETLQVAGADVKRSQAAIVEAERQVVTAEKNLLYQRERLSFTRIISPYDGLIVRRDRDPGGVVVPGSSIFQLISTNELWVSAWVDETAVAGLAPGQPARVVFRSESAKSYPGTVARLGRETDRETREFLVDVDAKDLPKNWSVGQRAEVYIETGRKDSALTVPLRLVSWRRGKPGVFVNENGRARWRDLKLGLRGLETVEVVEGLSAGESVCQPRDAKKPLADGQRIALP